ncbi:PepSY domain-containing protein [Lysobacter olei]
MTRPAVRLASIALSLAALVGAGDAMAQLRGVLPERNGAQDLGHGPQRDDDRPARGHDRRGGNAALAEAVRRVERRTGGQVLSAERVPYDGRDVSRVKVVDASGRVRVYMEDQPEPRTRGDDD